MSDRKTKPESCEECGAVFMTHPFHRRGKKGWLCSATCVAARRLRVHGRNCLHCTSRYVEESVVRRNAGFCSLHCKTENGKRLRMKACIHCKEEFESVNNTKFCSHKCSADHKRAAASKNCLCCGKTWYRHSISRKKSKHDSSKYHNCFCSKQCRGRHKTWEANRIARCGKCGKATGDVTVVNCGQCRLPEAGTWERRIAIWMRTTWEHKPKSWDDKLRAMMATNMHREALSVIRETKPNKKQKIRRRSTCTDKWNEACSKMILQSIQKQNRNKNKDPWTNTLYNWQTNQRKRMRIKEHRSRLKECEQS